MRGLGIGAFVGFLLVSGPATASNIVPGPDDPGHDAALAAKAEAFRVQLREFSTLPIGYGLDAKIEDPDNRALVEAFFESGETDFVAFSGKHPYEIIEDYGDYNHSAIFGGVQVAGDAFRYAVLRDGGAPEADVAAAREVFIRDLDALDWVVRVTGVPGVPARGIRRITSEPGEPPVPTEYPADIVPFYDGDGNPMPRNKATVYREDASGELPFLVWLDNASRDTVVGYVYALGVAYDIGANDPTIPSEKIERLRVHARDMGRRLTTYIDVGADDDADLVLIDWDGRPTRFHALSAEEILEGFVDKKGANGFHAIMGLGIMRTLFHVSGDEETYRRYRQLVGRRDYLGVIDDFLVDTLFFNEITNYSVVNMAYLAFYGVLRYESDPALARRYRELFEKRAYDVGINRDGRGLKMSFYDFMFAAFANTGTAGIGLEAVADGTETLAHHPSPPYWDTRVYQCDADEIASLDCELDDGTRIQLSSRRGYGGSTVVAVDPIPPQARVPSNFTWRADPHRVNGGGKPQMHFGGDFYGAYWLGRYMLATDDGMNNISPIARGEPEGFVEDEGCSCGTSGRRSNGAAVLLVAMLVLVGRRHERRPRHR